MDKQILIDKGIIGLPKLFNDMDFDNPVFTAKAKDFIMETFAIGDVEQFKYEVNQFTGQSSDEAIFQAIQFHTDQCMAELKQLALGYKIDLLTKRFQ